MVPIYVTKNTQMAVFLTRFVQYSPLGVRVLGRARVGRDSIACRRLRRWASAQFLNVEEERADPTRGSCGKQVFS